MYHGLVRLLIVTQAIDRNDPVLGFFHRWVEEFAKHCDHVHVIAQREGVHLLAGKITVHSLGKDKRISKLGQIFNFWKLIWSLRGKYDVVFVHMIPLWMILGGPLWMILQKPRYFWYEHRKASLKLRKAIWFSTKVFSASKEGMPIQTPKSIVTGHGIDTEKFSPDPARPPERTGSVRAGLDRHHIVSVGRITKSKRLELIINAFRSLPDVYKLSIIGRPATPEDSGYMKHIQHMIDAGLNRRVTIRAMAHDDLPPLLRSAAAFVHASQTGLDKAILEAMACGCTVVTCSDNVPDDAPGVEQCSEEELAMTLRKVLESDMRDPQASHGYVETNHGLPKLIHKLITEMNNEA